MFDYEPYFNRGDCTCEHPDEDHSWGGCEAEDCPCTACWEE